MKNLVPIPADCAVVFKASLQMLNPAGSLCEVCGAKMALHDWAIMDSAGYVIVGCSLRMEAPDA